MQKKQSGTFEKIEENEQTIAALRKRLENLMVQNENAGLDYLGFDAKTYEQISEMRKSIRTLTKRSRMLKNKIDTLRNGNQEFINDAVQGDFQQLSEFFTDTNIKDLSDIENFHIRIREILKEETEEEIAELEPMLQSCEAEIKNLQGKITDAGIADNLSQRILSQCVNISKRIDELEEENRNLKHERERAAARVLAERRLEQLITDQNDAMADIVLQLNKKMSELNQIVTDGIENPPVLSITGEKEIHFSTVGNTSEGTACKGLVLFDLAILALTGVPALIHDSNILHSISKDHYEKLLKLYQQAGKQVFIAADREGNKIIAESAVLHVTEHRRLFGFSWGRKKTQ